MADDKKNIGPEAKTPTEAAVPEQPVPRRDESVVTDPAPTEKAASASGGLSYRQLLFFVLTASNAPFAARLTTTAFTTHNAAVFHVSAPVKNVAISRIISATT